MHKGLHSATLNRISIVCQCHIIWMFCFDHQKCWPFAECIRRVEEICEQKIPCYKVDLLEKEQVAKVFQKV